MDEVAVPKGVGEGVWECEGLARGVLVGVGVLVGLGVDTDRDTVHTVLREGLALRVEREHDLEAVGVPDGLADSAMEGDPEAVAEEAVSDGEPEGLRLRLALSVVVRPGVGLRVTESEGERVGGLQETEGEGLAGPVRLGDAVGESVVVWVWVTVGLGLRAPESERLRVDVGVCEKLRLQDADGDCTAVREWVALGPEAEGAAVGLAESEAEAEGVGVAVREGEREGERGKVLVRVGVAV